MIGVIADAADRQADRMGTLDMQAPASGAMKLLKKLRGSSKPSRFRREEDEDAAPPAARSSS
jgi:hypothetical protein